MEKMSILMLPIMLNKMQKKIDVVSLELLKKHNISKIHIMYLMALYERSEGETLKELSEFLGFDKANTTRAITHLLKLNYVEKKIIGQMEIKYKVKLTEVGRNVASEIAAKSMAENMKIVNIFTEEEKLFLAKIVQKLIAFAEGE